MADKEKTSYTFALLAMVAIVAIVAIVVMFLNKGAGTAYVATEPESQEAMPFEFTAEEMELMIKSMEENNLVGEGIASSGYWFDLYCEMIEAVGKYYLNHENPYLRDNYEYYVKEYLENCAG